MTTKTQTMNRLKSVHWSHASRIKKAVLTEVAYQLPRWVNILKPFTHAAIRMHRFGWNRVDPTALYELVKPVLDSLVSLGVIPDDTEASITLDTFSQEIERGQGKQRLELSIDLN